MSNSKETSMVKDLTTGNVVTELLKFTFPLFVANLLQALYNLVDMIVVGQVLGGPGMSAVSVGGDVLHILTFVALGFSSAGQVLIAQQVGAGRMDKVKKLIGTMFTLLFIASIIISVLCILFKTQILNLLNTPAEAYDYTMDYMVTCAWGLVFIYGYNIVSAILRGMGDSKRPFIFVAVAAVVNTILDIWFVAGLGMEVYGAALATVIGQGVSFVASIIYLYIKRENFGFDFKLKSFAICREALIPMLGLGIPMAIQSAAVSLSKIVLVAWTNAFGVEMSAVGGIYNKVCMIIGVISMAFTTAGSAMVGQNIGAKKYDRIRDILVTTLVTGLIIGVVLSAIVLIFPDAVFRMFTTDESVLALAPLVIWPMIVNFFGSATRSAAFALINGTGNYKLNLAVAIIDGMISRVGFAALLGYAFSMGCVGFWYGDAIAGFMPMVIGGIYYLSGKWKEEHK